MKEKNVNCELVEYNISSGIGDLLLMNRDNYGQFRFYRIRNSWNDSFVMEFESGCSKPINIFWGDDYEGKRRISEHFLLFPPNERREWNLVNIFPRQYALDLEILLEKVIMDKRMVNSSPHVH